MFIALALWLRLLWAVLGTRWFVADGSSGNAGCRPVTPVDFLFLLYFSIFLSFFYPLSWSAGTTAIKPPVAGVCIRRLHGLMAARVILTVGFDGGTVPGGVSSARV